MTEPEIENLVLVVVGAHLRAEMHDRAVANVLREAVDEAVTTRWSAFHDTAGNGASGGVGGQTGRENPPRTVVLTDFWRLNDPLLAPLPQVSIGHPEVNALSAFLADKVPPAFVIDGELAVQFDAAAPEAIALCWGTDHRGTARAVDEFIARYLASFADAVLRELAN